MLNLNPEQKRAVEHCEGPLLILAGAGSGKTRVITARVAHLIHRGVPPWNILAVTFTNKAAEEMRHRIEGILNQQSRSIWVSTFHSTCLRLLRKHIEKIGYSNDFVIYDTMDQTSLMKRCLEEKKITDRVIKPQAALSRIDAAKNSLVMPEKYSHHAQDTFEEIIAGLYQLYQKKLLENNALDFGDLLVKTVQLFEEHPLGLESYRDLFRYIMVDEYQDTNQAQYRFISLLSKPRNNICVVGDEDQSIYGWRGANINNILNFENDFLGTLLIKLEQNYRSSQKILSAATKVIEHNRHRKGKILWTDRGEGKAPVLYEANDDWDEARFIVQQVQELKVLEGRKLSDFAIFYRTNAQSRNFEDELRKHNIPYAIYGGVKFYERREIKDVMAYLRVIINPCDSINLKRIINVSARGIGDKTIGVLEDYASQQNLSLYEVMGRADQIAGLNQGLKKKVLDFFKMMERLKKQYSGSRVTLFVKSVMEESGYIDDLKQQKTLEAESRLENLDELLNVISDYESREEEPTLERFIDQVSLVQDSDEIDRSGGVVSLMTIHLAKGLEFPVVFMGGMEEGLFPHSRSLGNDGELEEERRLCYVGMTRAKERLFFTRAHKRRLYGGEQYNLPSRFLEEIPQDYLECVGGRSMEKKEAFDIDFDQRPLEERSSLRIGSQVCHPTFGMGIVRRKQGKAPHQKVTVYFTDGRVKTLSLEHARLELIKF
ncbi:MAG: ATP-dependent DNA helicase PcrA [Deltaproteobacteria bacterium GWA2_50_8]|nr:MAG: ATP-dependent DNA helicase PcrA [Deltaproteobacteria bacterium GWA2_50_8]